jgi:hypothetical protein
MVTDINLLDEVAADRVRAFLAEAEVRRLTRATTPALRERIARALVALATRLAPGSVESAAPGGRTVATSLVR